MLLIAVDKSQIDACFRRSDFRTTFLMKRSRKEPDEAQEWVWRSSAASEVGGQRIWTVLSRRGVTEAGKRQLFVMMEGQEKQGCVEAVAKATQSDLLN